ncbi:MAG: hypothetical protein ABI429_04220 [Jatrophihabitantaceae bacterium]
MAANRFARPCSPAVAAASIMIAAAVSLSGCSSGSAAGPARSNATAANDRVTGPPSVSGAVASSSGSSAGVARTSAGRGGIAADTGFCRQATLAQQAQRKNVNAFTVDSPASLQKFEQQALGTLSGFVASAPSTIKDDVKVLVAADHRLYAALAAAHFDIRKINPDSLSELQTPAFTKATTSITAYLATSCGISTTPTG